MTSARRASTRRLLLVGTMTSLLLLVNMVRSTSGQAKITPKNSATPTEFRAGLATTTTTRKLATKAATTAPFPSSSATRMTTAERITPTTLITIVSTSGKSATTNTVLSAETTKTTTTTTTSPSPVLVEQRVLIVCSNSFTVVSGQSATTASVAVSGTVRTTTTTTTKSSGTKSSGITTSKPLTGTAETRVITLKTMTGAPTAPAVTTKASTTTLPDVAYASFLVGVIARAANISTTSRVVNMSVFGEPVTDRLVIQCTILDGKMPTAAEAVANLKRLTGSTNAGRRRRSASTSSYQLIDMYNQTLIPIKVISWIDAGSCPNDTCRNGGVCRGRTDGTLYCDCPSPDLQAPLCDAQSQNQEPWSCQHDVSCIVPAVVVPVFGLLLIVVTIVVIVIVVRRRRRKDVHVNGGRRDVKKKKKNNEERRTISSINATIELANLEGTLNGHSNAMTFQSSTFNGNAESTLKAESRSRFKKAKRDSKKVDRTTSSKDRRSQLDESKESNKRPPNVVLIGDDGDATTSWRTSTLAGISGTVSSTSMLGMPSDMGVISEMTAY